ncbi:MAG: DUF5011 domain-containing protein, partial [Actinomycetota bacterium]
GATALDNVDGDITASIVTVNPVDTSVLGTYTITYNVTDSQGNDAVEVTRTVDVVDTTDPVITLLGVSPVEVEVGSTYTDAGATALDNVDGDITASIVTVNPVDTSVLGTYTITYNVTDSQGNAAVEVTRTVDVVDTTKPVITLLGVSPVEVEVGSIYTDAGATALDNVDGDITASIVTVNPVDTSVLGTYTITYNVTDSQGNAAVEVTRTVDVVDTTKPVITLLEYLPDPTVNTILTYNGSVADATDIVAIQFRVDGGTWTDATFIVGLNPIFTFITPALSDGLVTIDVQAQDAAGNWSDLATDTVTVDANAPAGFLSINSGAASTTTTGITLNLSATDAAGVNGYRIANGTDASGGTEVIVASTINYSADISWTLPSGNGTKTVAVQYRDVGGDWSPNYTYSIILNVSVPTGGDTTPTITVAGITEDTTPAPTITVLGISEIPFTGLDPIVPISGGAAVIAGIAMFIASLSRRRTRKRNNSSVHNDIREK